ncbi:MAG: hypothetical protein PWP52_746 [Bacteroidales bacterium]|nr:hypothetical protein [Bacteroidales bacterium]
MKNKIYKTSLLLILVFLFSCSPDEIEMNEFSDIFITWSPLTIHVNEDVSLGDGSRGETSRLWTFPSGGGCEIKGSSELTSTERIVHATFFKAGNYDIRLQAEFIDPSIKLDSLITITVLE